MESLYAFSWITIIANIFLLILSVIGQILAGSSLARFFTDGLRWKMTVLNRWAWYTYGPIWFFIIYLKEPWNIFLWLTIFLLWLFAVGVITLVPPLVITYLEPILKR